MYNVYTHNIFNVQNRASPTTSALPHLTGPMQQSLGHHVVNAVNFGGKMAAP